MVKKIDVINWAKDLANRGTGVNYDGAYGMQCVDLPFWICGKFFGRPISGNAIDLLNSAKSAGYQVIYYSAGVYPKAGDIFVMHSIAYDGRDYGHTGLVIEDSNGSSMKTIEQNIDGNADALINGAPARYNTRSFSNMVGWIRPNYEDANSTTTENEEEEDIMFTISADGRGIALVQGGVFFPLLDSKDPIQFWNAGAKNIKVSTATFDSFQGKKYVGVLDDATVNKLISGIKG
ncbi:CHAP domain-containing protein [Streptococcus uberis]|uniref:CHAP domain-containing protein n=1 Tax=Streptococcus uberis TaxID=1349 RepID=UPI0020C0760E|nr:CHAP domain-containing protein [Streptococcus uberis]